MKKSTLLALVAALGLMTTSAMAANPYTWNFQETVAHGGSRTVQSPGFVDPAHNYYAYEYTITKVEGLSIFGWQNLTSLVPADKLEGEDFFEGTLPVDVINQSITADAGGISASADVHAWADQNGYLNLQLNNIDLGGIFAEARVTGTMTITGTTVPEPMSMITLAGCGVALVARRRRK